MTAVDEVNGRFGMFTAVPASQGFKRDWQMWAKDKSLAWTTSIDDVTMVLAN